MANDRRQKPVLHSKKHIARLERERQQTRIILYSFIGILVAVIGLLIYGYLDVKYFQLKQPVAKVGDTKITTSQWQTRVRLQRHQLLNQYTQYQQYAQFFGVDVSSQLQQIQQTLNSPTALGQQVLDQMINEEIIRQEAAKRGITVSADELEQDIQGAYGFYPNGTPTPTATPTEVIFPTLSPEMLALVTITPTATLEPTLTPAPTSTLDLTATPTQTLPPETPEATFTPQPTATPYTLEGFKDNYNKTVTDLASINMSEAEYRALYEANLLREKLFAAITADVPHEEEQVWARHILVADEGTAKDIRKRLKDGEDFAALAAAYSQDPGTKDKGGDLGWFGRGVVVAEFEQTAFLMGIGSISEPVKTSYGWHIIQVLGHEERPLPADQYEQVRQKAFSDWLQQAHDEYKVVTFDYWQGRVPMDPAFPTPAPGQ